MPRQSPTIRTIAHDLGLSKATVANAMRGLSNVAPATAQRVKEAAAKAGYRRNPMVATLMSALRRSHASGFHGVIACVDTAEPQRPDHGPFHRQLLNGAQTRADDLGYKLEKYFLGPAHLSVSRLNSILKSRGINGIMLMPAWSAPDLSALDWSLFTAVCADYVVSPPYLHAVCCDHYRSMMTLLDHVKACGYRRPGLFMETGRDERIHSRMSAAFRAFHASHPEIEMITPYTTADVGLTTFLPWFKRHKPDVVLTHHTEALEMMEELRLRIPEQCGFVCLNLSKTSRVVAGLDLQPHLIGARCIESLIAQLQRNDRGMPTCASTLTLPARIIAGPTLRAPIPSSTP